MRPRHSRHGGTNPRALGTNPRAQGTNPRGLGTSPTQRRLATSAVAEACPIDWTLYFSLTALLERGWTRESIVALLGAPDTVVPNTFNAQSPPMRLYAIERVRRAERSWAWRGWRDHGIDRKIDRYERHTQTTKPSES